VALRSMVFSNRGAILLLAFGLSLVTLSEQDTVSAGPQVKQGAGYPQAGFRKPIHLRHFLLRDEPAKVASIVLPQLLSVQPVPAAQGPQAARKSSRISQGRLHQSGEVRRLRGFGKPGERPVLLTGEVKASVVENFDGGEARNSNTLRGGVPGVDREPVEFMEKRTGFRAFRTAGVGLGGVRLRGDVSRIHEPTVPSVEEQMGTGLPQWGPNSGRRSTEAFLLVNYPSCPVRLTSCGAI